MLLFLFWFLLPVIGVVVVVVDVVVVRVLVG